MTSEKELSLNIGELGIPYTISVSTRAKNIKLVIDTKGLRVIKPQKAKMNDVDRILKDKSKWIYKYYIEFQRVKMEESKRQWISGETIPYKGENCDIEIFSQKDERISLSFKKNRFEVFVNETVCEEDKKILIEEIFRKWFVKNARINIKERLDYFTKITGLTYNTFRIKEQKTRWGSCSQKKNLNFNWKLIMAPDWIMDYVILHEVCHLRHLNHSKEFWALVEIYMPTYKKAEEWINSNGSRLRL
jgi:hypothetical protein